VKNSFVASAGVAALLRLVMLFCREKVGWPTGIFPRAFSDMPLNCIGMDSSTDDAIDAVLEAPETECIGDCGTSAEGVSSASESSSSPIANALFSSGTLPSVGVRETVGLLMLSSEFVLWRSAVPSLRNWLWRSISSCPLSSVKSRRAWNLLRDRTMAYMRLGLSWRILAELVYASRSELTLVLVLDHRVQYLQ
jgi:hypothetical protein